MQETKEPSSPWKTLQEETKDSWKDWDRIERLPKLNQMSGGVPDAESELSKSAVHFAYLLNAQKSHFERIKVWAEKNGCPLKPLDVFEEAQRKALERRPDTLKSVKSAREMAVRYILHRIGNTVRVCSDSFADTVIKWFVSNNIFLNKKDKNKFFFNRLGALYVSPYSTRGHQPYTVREDIVETAPELLHSLGELLEDVSILKNLEPETQDTFLKLNRLWLSLQLSGLNSPVPVEIAELDLPSGLEQSIPIGLRIRETDKFVSASSVRKLFNLYASLLSGIQIVLRRSRFYLRSKFSWVDNNVLHYAPKEQNWTIPERYKQADSWKPVFESNVLVFNDDGSVDTLKTFDKISTLSPDKISALKPLLIQLPHDWCYSLPFPEKSGEVKKTFRITKKDKEKKKIDTIKNFARLIGPSSMKSQLDALIMNPYQITVSDMTLLIDQPVNQRKDGGDNVVLDYESYEMTLAIPIARNKLKADENKSFPFTRIVAIDQGEAGLAYAVFELDEVGNPKAEPIASGTIRIPSIRRLIKRVRKFRKSGQKTQKFNQKFDSSMFTLRENVIGDVCGIIVGLMHRFRAFPVLEYLVKNFESGSRQLGMVYKSVNARFLFSDVPMQNAEREAWWYKGNYWTVPQLFRLVPQTEKYSSKKIIKLNGKQYRPLNVFPGVSVNAADTSRICSCCGKNIMDLIGKAEEKDKIKDFEVNNGGEVVIGGETIKLYDKPDMSLRKDFARKNENVPLNTPISAGKISIQDLKSLVRRNLRRPPKSKQSKDTTQSRYFCVFKDCEAHNQERHADVNAERGFELSL